MTEEDRKQLALEILEGRTKPRRREPLIARPVQGPVDYEAELQDLMRSFPKTLEYLRDH